jgi:serine/threonine protein kinase
MVFRFLVNIKYAFQDRENLYLVSDLLTGGDLRFHIGKKKRFSEDETRFMMGCLILGLEYMHSQSVIHRDIKPENIIMEANGYLRITDFGISKMYRVDNSADTSGTPGYMAPEVMCRQNHTYAVDYFALGVIGYEFMLGRRPYIGKTRKDIRDMMFSTQV